jgi:heptosyltransferase-2
MINTSCKNLLVRGVNWIGDAVMTMPALRALRKTLPEARISLLVKPWVSPVFEQNPDIDEIIPYADNHRGFIGKLKLAMMLRKKHFCSAILLQNAFDAAMIAFLAGIKERSGYNRDGRGFLLTNAVPLPQDEKNTHQIYYYLNLIGKLGLEAGYSDPYIHLALDERLHARELLKQMKMPVLGINPGAAYGSAKRWLPDRFADVANWFISNTGGSVILFGGKSDITITDEIYRKVIPGFRTSDSLQNFAGRTSLRELIALISECDVFLTNDSGPLHVAYAVRTPMVAIFGSTDPNLTGPPSRLTDNTLVVTPDVPCSPCFERTCKNNDMRCMYAITADDVYYGVQKLLPDKPAVFFDRDGTLCEDTNYINSMKNLYIFPDIDELKSLRNKGFKLIGVTNQSGIARNIVDEGFVKKVNRIFIEQYGFDDFYYCPHHPDEHCPCRKPEPEMLLRARAQHRINLKKSYVIGDNEADLLLAKAVGAKAVLVRTGKLNGSQHADFTARDMKEAVRFILHEKN